MEEDPNSVPRLGKRMDAPISWQVLIVVEALFSNKFALPVGEKGCCLEWPGKPTAGDFIPAKNI